MLLRNMSDKWNYRCVKKSPYSEFFWSLFSRIRIEYGKIRTRKTPKTDTFYAVYVKLKNQCITSRAIQKTNFIKERWSSEDLMENLMEKLIFLWSIGQLKWSSLWNQKFLKKSLWYLLQFPRYTFPNFVTLLKSETPFN